MEFQHKGKTVRLQGVINSGNMVELQEISVDKVEKWHKGNDIWATVVLERNKNQI